MKKQRYMNTKNASRPHDFTIVSNLEALHTCCTWIKEMLGTGVLIGHLYPTSHPVTVLPLTHSIDEDSES